MKTIANITASIVAILMLFVPAIQRTQQPGIQISVSSLGNPLTEHYSTGIPARTVWSLKCYDNKLFVACGDYDTNAGPVPILYFDMEKHIWVNSGTVEDEQINSFHVIDGKLIAPGIDPRQDWNFGNLYVFQDQSWQTLRTIPNGIHQFDITEYKGKLFVATGTIPGHSPLMVSEDGGQSFREVPMYKGDDLVDTAVLSGYPDAEPRQIRAYNFFLYNDFLYAFYMGNFDQGMLLQLYRFENDRFIYYSQLPEEFKFKRTNYSFISASAEFGDSMYLTTGNLYRTEDMITAKLIEFGQEAIVTDLLVQNNRLYACVTAKDDNGTYRNSVWVNDGFQPDSFREIFYYYFSCPAQCFEYQNGNFYFGMGEGTLSESNEDNGTILTVSYDAPKNSVE